MARQNSPSSLAQNKKQNKNFDRALVRVLRSLQNHTYKSPPPSPSRSPLLITLSHKPADTPTHTLRIVGGMADRVGLHPVQQLAAKLMALHSGKSIEVALLSHAHKIPRRFDPHIYPFSLLGKGQGEIVERFLKTRMLRRCSIAGCPEQHTGFKDIIVLQLSPFSSSIKFP